LLKGKLANLSLSDEKDRSNPNLNIFIKDDETSRPIISTQIRKALFYFLASSKCLTLMYFYFETNYYDTGNSH
jgi:hypothetical protein